MATDFVLQLNAGQYSTDKTAALDALDIVSRLENELSYFKTDSIIGQLNREVPHVPVFPSTPIYQLLQLCQELYLQTSGAFDISSGQLWELWGFSRREGRVPSPEQIATALIFSGYDTLTFDALQQSVCRTNDQVRFNLGAIGKGYALDRSSRFLLDSGISDFLFHGGQSSVAAHGNRTDQQGWSIGIHNPLRQPSAADGSSTRLETIQLNNQALATSGSQTQFFRAGGKRYGHIIDPRTGQPSLGVYSVTVIVPLYSKQGEYDCFAAARADALATAFYILGCQAGTQFCELNPGYKMIFVVPDTEKNRPYQIIHTGEDL